MYITNIVKDRPPENRDPTPQEIRLYAPFLVRQLNILQPEVIATLGRFAMDFILELFPLLQPAAAFDDNVFQAYTHRDLVFRRGGIVFEMEESVPFRVSGVCSR